MDEDLLAFGAGVLLDEREREVNTATARPGSNRERGEITVTASPEKVRPEQATLFVGDEEDSVGTAFADDPKAEACVSAEKEEEREDLEEKMRALGHWAARIRVQQAPGIGEIEGEGAAVQRAPDDGGGDRDVDEWSVASVLRSRGCDANDQDILARFDTGHDERPQEFLIQWVPPRTEWDDYPRRVDAQFWYQWREFDSDSDEWEEGRESNSDAAVSAASAGGGFVLDARGRRLVRDFRRKERAARKERAGPLDTDNRVRRRKSRGARSAGKAGSSGKVESDIGTRRRRRSVDSTFPASIGSPNEFAKGGVHPLLSALRATKNIDKLKELMRLDIIWHVGCYVVSDTGKLFVQRGSRFIQSFGGCNFPNAVHRMMNSLRLELADEAGLTLTSANLLRASPLYLEAGIRHCVLLQVYLVKSSAIPHDSLWSAERARNKLGKKLVPPAAGLTPACDIDPAVLRAGDCIHALNVDSAEKAGNWRHCDLESFKALQPAIAELREQVNSPKPISSLLQLLPRKSHKIGSIGGTPEKLWSKAVKLQKIFNHADLGPLRDLSVLPWAPILWDSASKLFRGTPEEVLERVQRSQEGAASEGSGADEDPRSLPMRDLETRKSK